MDATPSLGGSARVIRELVDHSPHHPAASRARAAFSTRPEMSHTTFTVPNMNEPPRRHDITIRVAKQAGRHTDPGFPLPAWRDPLKGEEFSDGRDTQEVRQGLPGGRGAAGPGDR